MNFPYPLVSTFTSSFNTASYFSGDDVNNYNQNTNNPDIFFGKSDRDVVEFSYFNTIGEQNGWVYKNPKSQYMSQVGIYNDVDTNQFTYNYRKVKTNYINYQNNLLIDVGSDLSSSNVFDGQHIVSYNFTRTVAGSQSYPLIISDISPSRTELKLIPTFQKQSTDKNVFYENLHYESFCRKLVLIEDVVELIATSLDNFNCENNYKSYSQSNPSDIATFKNTFGFKFDADAISFINSVYDGSQKLQLDLFNNTTIKNLFGVKNYIKYWLYTYSKNIVSFQELTQQIKYIVQKEYLNELAIINVFNADITNNLQIVSTIVYDNFVQSVLRVIENAFLNKFYSYYKNSLNFGSGLGVKFIDHSFSSKNESESKHIELLVKLDSPLSFDYAVKTKCWISNISIAPIVQNVILMPLKTVPQYKIGGPDFSVKINNANKYGYNNIDSLDKNLSDTELSQINIIDKLKNLNIDYSKFENFVIFSSAAIRIKVFKSKLESINSTNIQIQTLSAAATSSNTIISASYSSDIQSLQNSTLSIQNSFDGYESYLYTNQSLIQGSLSDTNSNYHNYIIDAENYDIQNIDSLVNNTPEYLKLNEDNNDYLLFLSMVGHHFDNIYQYVKSFPILNRSTSSNDYLPDLVYYMLKTFGWDTSTDFANKSTLSSYATDSSSISAKNKNEIIWKRILDTLPQIYKTKGTEECINLLLSCYGVPLNILTIREFGGNDIFQSSKTSYVYDAKYYFTKYQSGTEYVTFPYTSSAKSLEFTFKTEKSYVQNQRINLVTKDTSWNLSLLKSKVDNYGDIIFNIQDKSMKIENVPIFNGDSFYSVLLRRNSTSSFLDTNSTEDYIPTQYDLVVKSYDGDREVFNHSSSMVLTKTYNQSFSQDGHLYFGNFPTSNKNFTGLLDKINLIQNPISDEYFSEYSRNYNFYGNNDVTNTWNDLIFRYNFDYPINLASSSIVPISPHLPVGQSALTASGYNFVNNSVTQSNACTFYSQSTYPYQFEQVDVVQSIFVSHYGPNKLKNNKIRKVEQILTSAPSPVQTVSQNIDVFSPDSNLMGVFISPFKVKDDDIINFLGDYNVMNSVADPGNIYQSSYKDLKSLSQNYYQYNGEPVLYQEFMTLYKNYIDNSTFDSIRNVVPARTKLLTGVLIEPSLLERPRIQLRPPTLTEVNINVGDIDTKDNIAATVQSSEQYSSTIDENVSRNQIKQFNLNRGYISNDDNDYYLTTYVQQNVPFFDYKQNKVCSLREVVDEQYVYINDKLENPIKVTLRKIVAVSSSVADGVGSQYITNVDVTSTITNVLPFQHLSYKNKPLSKFAVYLNNEPLYFPSNQQFTASNSDLIQISNTTFGIGNIYLDNIFVKSQNSQNTTIISSYEITSSGGTVLSYSPVLIQSSSMSQSIFII